MKCNIVSALLAFVSIRTALSAAIGHDPRQIPELVLQANNGRVPSRYTSDFKYQPTEYHLSRRVNQCDAPLDRVISLLEDARELNNTVAANSSALLGCPDLDSALVYLDSYMDMDELEVVAPSSTFTKRACLPTNQETCANVPTLGNSCPAADKVCGEYAGWANLHIGIATTTFVVGGIIFIPYGAAWFFAGATWALQEYRRFVATWHNNQLIQTRPIARRDLAPAQSVDLEKRACYDRVKWNYLQRSNSKTVASSSDIANALARFTDGLKNCNLDNVLFTMDNHGSWWSEQRLSTTRNGIGYAKCAFPSVQGSC